MALFGSQVTVLNRSDKILGKEDREAGISWFSEHYILSEILFFYVGHSISVVVLKKTNFIPRMFWYLEITFTVFFIVS